MAFDPDIPASRVATFVRQYAHDIRNGLNALDLEAALLQEISTDPEAQESAKRLREQVRALSDQVRSVSSRFHDPQPLRAPLAARDLFLIFREQNDRLLRPVDADWQEALGDEQLQVDAGMIADLFRELLANAAAFPGSGRIAVRASATAEAVEFELREPKSAPVTAAPEWGTTPFASTRRGGYGLGLWTARRLAEANGASLTREFEPAGTLVTRLRFPRS